MGLHSLPVSGVRKQLSPAPDVGGTGTCPLFGPAARRAVSSPLLSGPVASPTVRPGSVPRCPVRWRPVYRCCSVAVWSSSAQSPTAVRPGSVPCCPEGRRRHSAASSLSRPITELGGWPVSRCSPWWVGGCFAGWRGSSRPRRRWTARVPPRRAEPPSPGRARAPSSACRQHAQTDRRQS